jgi:hypothetical protein
VRSQSANRSYSPQYVSSSLCSRGSARSKANAFRSSLPDCRNGAHPMPETGSRRSLWTGMLVQRSGMGGKPEKVRSTQGLATMTDIGSEQQLSSTRLRIREKKSPLQVFRRFHAQDRIGRRCPSAAGKGARLSRSLRPPSGHRQQRAAPWPR